MISKLTVWGEDRQQAIALMIDAINAYEIEGVQTTLPFGLFAMEHDAFDSGNFDTGFVPTHFSKEIQDEIKQRMATLAALMASGIDSDYGSNGHYIIKSGSRWPTRKAAT